MRLSRLLLPALVVAGPALAQVTTNDNALNALKTAPPALPPATGELAPPAPTASPAPTVPAPTHRRVFRHPVQRVQPSTSHVVSKAPPAPLPAVPLAPPPNPVIAPPSFVMPAHPRPNPPPVPIKPDAVGAASPIQGGTRITFGPGSASLNPATHAALLAIAARARANPVLQVSVIAWAPGSPDDPSIPRALALERALAARAVLINAGVVSDRIFAIANGLVGIGAGPPDRLDVTLALPRSAPTPTPAVTPPHTATPPPRASAPVHP